MKKAAGFNLGIRGDLMMNTVAARAFKELNPDWRLDLGVGPQFADMEPLFRNHPHIDNFFTYTSYDNWPNEYDQKFLEMAKYDYVFNGMPQHTHSEWWRFYHQCEETCYMHRMNSPKDGYQCHLNQWFGVPDLKNYIAFNYVGAFYAGYPNNKSYSPERANEIVKLIKKKGYKVIVLGDPKEPLLEGTERHNLSYFESVRTMLGCKAFVGIDSGLTWCASAYSFPTLACYSNSYYIRDNKNYVKNIQPINPNSQYLDSDNLNNISLDKIEQVLDNMLK